MITEMIKCSVCSVCCGTLDNDSLACKECHTNKAKRQKYTEIQTQTQTGTNDDMPLLIEITNVTPCLKNILT